jgi:hypothetical protein
MRRGHYAGSLAGRVLLISAARKNVMPFVVVAFASCARTSGAIEVTFPDAVKSFDLCEMRVTFPPQVAACLATLPDTQIHDAYDADRNGIWLRLSAKIERDGTSMTVPGFAMHQSPAGPWEWRIRFAPRDWRSPESDVTIALTLECCAGPSEKAVVMRRTSTRRVAFRGSSSPGPLAVPGADENPHYLVQTGFGWRRSSWLFGACRAWVVDSQDEFNDWYPHEWLDRRTELLAPMRRGGFNLLNQWMAPWEYLILHHDRAEFWKDESGRFRRWALPATSEWSPFQCFDQGRAAAFDKLVAMCEGAGDETPVYLLLSPLPHQCFQVKEHPWGGQESGWSPGNDEGKQTLERLNGLSGFGPAGAAPSSLSIWDFFEANPRAPLDDWRSMLFDHLANFHRYVIARWGYSKAIGVWVLVDELDAIGDVVGDRKRGTGWWGHPSCERWLADLVRMYKGRLRRSDGLPYQGDPFAHPVHAATTSFGGEAGRGGNIDWEGGPEDARPDLFGFHWYPHWGSASRWSEAWSYTIEGVAAYADAPIGDHPRLISEFGAPDRTGPRDSPSLLYPTLYHHAIWAAVFTGQAGTPMDWDDGKQFGELAPRARAGIFDAESYPIDHVAQMKALRAFLAPIDPGRVAPCMGERSSVRIAPVDGSTLVYALHELNPRDTAAPGTVYGWLFAPDTAPGTASFAITGLPAGTYTIRRFDPWTGRPIPGFGSANAAVTKADASLTADAGAALQRLAASAPPFPSESRLARGQDVAFTITPAVRAAHSNDELRSFDTVLIVLGDEPLDDATPTADMVARVERAVAFQKGHAAALLVFTGGPTAGTSTEARMMANLAIARGVPADAIRLEEHARSTGENARFTAELVRHVDPKRILIVSKDDHLQWAIPIFTKVDAFRAAQPLPCHVDRAECIGQMEEYLSEHDSPRVQRRLQNLREGIRGTD